jgi:peptidoglycan/LPS O-acetylase OafA/YrhL
MNKELRSNPRIFGLDLVRAMAIVLVLISHVYYLIDSSNLVLISISGLCGFTGVELFFVLSGFLIGSILLKLFISDRFSSKELIIFLKRRWFRTLPAYYLVLLLNVILAVYLGYDIEGWWKYFFFIQNFSSYQITFFNESWSLSIEEFAYILAPIALFIGWKIFKRNKKQGFLMICLLLIMIFHVLRYIFYLNSSIRDMNAWSSDIKSIVLYRIDAIIIGFIVAWLHYYYPTFLQKYCIYFFIVAIHLFFLQFVVFNVFGFDINTKPIYFNVFYFTFSASTLALGLPVFIFWETANTKIAHFVQFISKISYSIYLLHYSIITVLLKYVVSLLKVQIHPFLIVFIYVSVTVFFSYLLYKFYEKPMMNLRDKKI